MKEKFFLIELKNWKRLLGEGVKHPFLEVIKLNWTRP